MLPAGVLHDVVRDLETAHRLDLPLRAAVPDRVGAPQHALRAHQVHELSEEGRAEPRVRDGRRGEGGTDLRIDVVHAELLRDPGEVGRPLDVAGLHEFGHLLLGRVGEPRTHGRVVDHEVHAGPVLGGLAEVVDRRGFPGAGERLLVVPRHQALVDADRVDAGLHGLLVEGVHQLLVVEAPRVLRRAERVADRVGLPRDGLQHLDRAIDLVHPVRVLRRDDGVAQHARAAGQLVDGATGVLDGVVRQQPPRRIVEGRAREQRHLRVGVEEDLLQVVVHLVAGQRHRGIGDVRVDLGADGPFRQAQQAFLLEVVADEVGLVVEDELAGQLAAAVVGHLHVARLGLRHIEHGPEHLVHREEGRGHAGVRGEEGAAVHAVAPRLDIAHLLDEGLDPALVVGLRERVVLAVRDHLGGDR